MIVSIEVFGGIDPGKELFNIRTFISGMGH